MGFYDPPDTHEGSYKAPECKGYITGAKIQTVDLPERLQGVLDYVTDGLAENAIFLLEQVIKESALQPIAEDVECNWPGGAVDAWFTGGKESYTAHWTCPICGNERSEDREAGDDDPRL